MMSGLLPYQLKVGPVLRFCDEKCYAADCLKRYPGTSLADMITRMYSEKSKE